MTSSSCPPRLQTLPPSYVLEAVPVPRDSLVAWSLSAPNQTCVIYTLWRIQNIYSAPTEAVTWSIHCSEEYKIEVKNSPLPRPLSTYNSLIVLFPVTSESHSLWLVYVFTIVSSRNLPCLFTMPFSLQNIYLATSIILCDIAYLFLTFLCLVPSLCLYIKLSIIYWHWKGTNLLNYYSDQ